MVAGITTRMEVVDISNGTMRLVSVDQIDNFSRISGRHSLRKLLFPLVFDAQMKGNKDAGKEIFVREKAHIRNN
ncbi:hypothetical protein K1719_027999 [Acacia pycnantha]|nr:hypothetical protein K1719_027999 [Acacia pycnantha]